MEPSSPLVGDLGHRAQVVGRVPLCLQPVMHLHLAGLSSSSCLEGSNLHPWSLVRPGRDHHRRAFLDTIKSPSDAARALAAPYNEHQHHSSNSGTDSIRNPKDRLKLVIPNLVNSFLLIPPNMGLDFNRDGKELSPKAVKHIPLVVRLIRLKLMVPKF